MFKTWTDAESIIDYMLFARKFIADCEQRHGMSEVEKVEGTAGNYSVSLKINPRYVNENCTCCGDCTEACETEIDSFFDFGMQKIKGAHLPFEMAFPARFVIHQSVKESSEDAQRVKDSCKYDAVDFDMEPKTINLQAGSIIWATGWEPYDANKLTNLKYGTNDNVITNMMMERMASPNGPTNGEIKRPSDGQAPESVAFVQCAGSRDENHLSFCSYICCMASLKQATYVRERHPEAKIYIFYIDMRAPGLRYEKFYQKVKEDENIIFVKGKVADIDDASDGKVTVVAENAVTGEKIHQTVDMAVLATGMQPSTADVKLPADLKYSEEGFIINDFQRGGMFAVGCANKPLDVVTSNQNATGMALKAIQTLANK
jgi:quinone-modifying oxidoreductase subunit QmoA